MSSLTPFAQPVYYQPLPHPSVPMAQPVYYQPIPPQSVPGGSTAPGPHYPFLYPSVANFAAPYSVPPPPYVGKGDVPGFMQKPPHQQVDTSVYQGREYKQVSNMENFANGLSVTTITTKGMYKFSKVLSAISIFPALLEGKSRRSGMMLGMHEHAKEVADFISPTDAAVIATWFINGNATKTDGNGNLKNSLWKTAKMGFHFFAKCTEMMIYSARRGADLGRFAASYGNGTMQLVKDSLTISASITSMMDSYVSVTKDAAYLRKKHFLNFIEESAKLALIIGWRMVTNPVYSFVAVMSVTGLVASIAGMGKVIIDAKLVENGQVSFWFLVGE